MKKLILLLILCVGFANFAYARLGETLEELEKRFGKGMALGHEFGKTPFSKTYIFKKKGITVKAYFVGGKQCDMISYSATPGQILKPEEIEKLLALNSGSNKWVKTDKPERFEGDKSLPKPKISYKSSGGGHFAYNFGNRTIAILTKNYLAKYKEHQEKVAKEKQEKEKKKLDGF